MPAGAGRYIEIFTEAVQLSAEERVAFLDRSCAGDEKLRQKIEALLKSNDRAGQFLERPPAALDRGKTREVVVGEKPGDIVGKYKLLQQIGEGGCGIVFMAEQEKPVHRRVALKVIKPGMDTKSVIARFEAERQALAMMDHPSIARVLDAGATDSGRPYFVMELVKGLKISDYCDEHSVPTRSRLELFIQVCDAIQHAHQRGIIHRDIKPSNILVTTVADEKPLPKVIDFGIAKATTGLRLTDKTIFTSFEMLIGTPAYMSPEQAALTSAEVDTRTDIYSLGVLLYELLTGTTPFDTQELLKAGIDEVRRVIRDEEPARPSTRLSTMAGADTVGFSKRHATELPKLIREMRGDLDWIVMKTLEKDRERRYATANGLAMDVRRYLSGEAVLARPPSGIYKLQKLFLRNKPVFIALGMIFLLLIVALTVTTRLAIVQRHALKLAEALKLESKANTLARGLKAEEAESVLREALAIRRRYLDGEPPSSAAELVVDTWGYSLRRLDKGVALLNELLTPEMLARSDSSELITKRADMYGRQGSWQAAIPDAARLVQLQPDNSDRYHTFAALLVATTNLNAYQNLCSNILFHFGNTTNYLVADPMAKDCLILPSSGVDLKTVAAMATMVVTRGKGHGSFHFFACCQAMAQYRIGNYSEAVAWAQESVKNPFPHSQAEAFAVMAMAQHQLGNEDDAQQALTNCQRVIETKLPQFGQILGQDWKDWIIAHALRNEADALINH